VFAIVGLLAQTPQVEQEKAWADGWQNERRREKSPRRLTRGERGGNGGRFGSLQSRRARFWGEAVDRAKVLVRREDQELRQKEALAAQEQQRLAALEEQHQNEMQRQAPSQWYT
jgi:hypothetical protein